MKVSTRYLCEYCGASYLNEEEALECEKQHRKPVQFGEMEYEEARFLNDHESHYPKFIHVQFEGGGQIRYRRA